jgi:S-adenosylmethionine decarboxylase
MSQFSAISPVVGGSPVSTSEHSPSPTPEYIPGCFEGPEKTMEVCFIPGIGDADGLRKLTRKQLDFLCTEAKCSILSKISSSYMDAYVLSESSLFIYKHRYIMKTCGTTTLLHCLDSLLRFADELKMELMWVGYSRKNLLFPTQQAWPHSNFGDEIEFEQDVARPSQWCGSYFGTSYS